MGRGLHREPMDPIDVALRLRPDGVVSWTELRRAGVPSAAVSRAVSRGRLIRHGRGLYRVGGISDGEACRAAALALGGTLSHTSAARIWGLDVPDAEGVHVTVRRNRSAAAPAVRVHRRDLHTDEWELYDGVPVTSVLRTILDCASWLELREGVAVADSALRQGLCGIEELQTTAAAARGPGSGRQRRVASLADFRSESVLETLLRVLLVLAGLAPTHLQLVVLDEGRFVARVDMAVWWARLLIEADGVRFHASREARRRDQHKDHAFLQLGWTCLRFGWDDVLHDPDYVVAVVRQELERARKAHADPSRDQG